VDFDLEAPSLPSFVPPRPEESPHPGLVEFIDEYLRSGKVPDVENYVYQAKPIHKDCADFWIMPAGRGDDDYWRAFHRIEWQELYDLQDGFILFEDLKYQLQESFHPDYVLIDARAGINDRLAVCTRHLPDAVVMLLTSDNRGEAGADEQAGFLRVFRDILTESLQSSPPRIDLLTVASQVPDLDEEEDLCFIGLLGLADDVDNDPDGFGLIFKLAVAIPHAAELLRDKQALASPRPPWRLFRAYRRLADALIWSNCTSDPDGARAFLKELQLHPDRAVGLPALQWTDRWSDCTAKLDRLIDNFDRDPDILARAASCLFLAGRYDDAMQTLDRAVDSAPHSDSIRWQRASYRRRLKLPGVENDLFRLLDASPPPKPLDFGALLRIAKHLPDTAFIYNSDPLNRDYPDVNPYVASAFQQLRRLGREAEASRKPRIQQLPPEARQALIADTPRIQEHPLWLIRARQWQAAIARLESRIAQPPLTNPWDLFYLAMAYWGAGNEARATELCQQARAIVIGGMANHPDAVLQGLDTDGLQEAPFLSLMFWRAGDGDTAKRFLDRCDELLAEAPEADAFFSVWRLAEVNRRQFEADGLSLRRMIQGVAIRPYFLGKQPDSA
jgi:tetratricopeptide (TPR) repeat protein